MAKSIKTPNQTRTENTLRLIALSTTDPLARAISLDELNECEEKAKDELSKTCWTDNINDLRGAAKKQYLPNDN